MVLIQEKTRQYSLHGRVNHNDPVKKHRKLSYLLTTCVEESQIRPCDVRFNFEQVHSRLWREEGRQ
jgi:hypothetical protein